MTTSLLALFKHEEHATLVISTRLCSREHAVLNRVTDVAEEFTSPIPQTPTAIEAPVPCGSVRQSTYHKITSTYRAILNVLYLRPVRQYGLMLVIMRVSFVFVHSWGILCINEPDIDLLCDRFISKVHCLHNECCCTNTSAPSHQYCKRYF